MPYAYEGGLNEGFSLVYDAPSSPARNVLSEPPEVQSVHAKSERMGDHESAMCRPVARLKDRNLKKKSLDDGEDPLVIDDIPSDDEWFLDDEDDVPRSQLNKDDLNVDFFEGVRNKRDIKSTSKHLKRKVIEIEDNEEEWEDVASDNEEDEGAINYHDDSDEDPLSDGSRSDLFELGLGVITSFFWIF
ncbi:hypothetical protein L484_028009 [Morus notabilis]|uniref:Uncharacterized protein n=1 Tax=Morus notabilis TaxID=981085 RepID=W9S7Q3_9ROSA|nr:hypothetical protein L484_028009 [Morus notabilis]